MADKPVDHNHIIRPDRFTEDEPETFMRFYLPPDEEDEELEDEEWDDDDDFDDEEEVSQHDEEPSVSLLNFHGLNIGIECPAGKPRKPGYEPLAHDYGSIRRTEGKDGDQIDVFIGPFKEHSEVVFVFDQPREDGKTFDEHKVMIGFINQNDAELALRANYPAGWIVGSCTAMTVSQFKAWLGQGDTAKPVEEQVSAFGEGDAPCAPFRVEQFAEEPAHIKKLREFVQKGTSTKILEALKKIKALKAAGSVGIQTMAGMIEKEIRTLQPLIAQDLTAGMYGSAIQGVKEAVQSLPEQAIPEALPAAGAAAPTPELVLPENITLPALDDAVDVLRASPAAAGVDYKQTAELVRQGAFAITADLADTAVEQVRDILADSLRDGTILPDFIDQVAEKLGTGTLADHHVENIFRTNTMAAFSAGQARALNNPIVNDHFPYASYGATRDARTRKEHKALEKLGLNGTNFYRVDDPTFQKFRPPWDYQCRCVWTPRTVEQAARAGVKEAQDWMDRAKKMATDKGGSFYQYLSAVAPATPEYVKAPEFEPPPEFRKL